MASTGWTLPPSEPIVAPPLIQQLQTQQAQQIQQQQQMYGALTEQRAEQQQLANFPAFTPEQPAPPPSALRALLEPTQPPPALSPGWVDPSLYEQTSQTLPLQPPPEPGGGGTPIGPDDTGFLPNPHEALSNWLSRWHEPTSEQKALVAAWNQRRWLEQHGTPEQQAWWRWWFAHTDRNGHLLDQAGA